MASEGLKAGWLQGRNSSKKILYFYQHQATQWECKVLKRRRMDCEIRPIILESSINRVWGKTGEIRSLVFQRKLLVRNLEWRKSSVNPTRIGNGGWEKLCRRSLRRNGGVRNGGSAPEVKPVPPAITREKVRRVNSMCEVKNWLLDDSGADGTGGGARWRGVLVTNLQVLQELCEEVEKLQCDACVCYWSICEISNCLSESNSAENKVGFNWSSWLSHLNFRTSAYSLLRQTPEPKNHLSLA